MSQIRVLVPFHVNDESKGMEQLFRLIHEVRHIQREVWWQYRVLIEDGW